MSDADGAGMVEASARLFIAVTPPPEVLEALGLARRELEGRGLPRLRWVAPERLHLTLKFLGQTPPDRIDDVAAAMEESAAALAPIELRLAEWGTFGGRGGRAPRVLWVGLSGEVEALVGCAEAVDAALSARGFEPEPRPFRPHLTLARVPDRASAEDRAAVARAVAEAPEPTTPAFRVTALDLVRSHLGGGAARYEALRRAPLGPS